VAWLVATASILLGTATPALADKPSIDTSSQQTTVRAEDLGGAAQIRVPGDGLAQRFVVNVPRGLKPLSIHADWQRTPEITAGALTVEQDSKAIASADVASAPLVADGVTIPLRNPAVVDDTFTFDLRVRPGGDRAVCSPLLETGAVTFTDTSIVFSGDDTPDSVSDFLPVALQRLVISVPPAPTPAQAQAAFDVTTLAVRSFGVAPDKIETVPLGQDVKLGELERNIAIDPSAPTGVTVNGRTARVGGSDDAITKGASALATDARVLAQTPQAIIDQATRTALPNRSRYSFDDLHIPAVNLDGIGRVERTISLSQANVGGPAHSWDAHIVGAYEPQPDNSKATFSVLTNGTLLKSVLLDKSGLLDVSVRLPDALAGRTPSLTFRFDTDPASGSCTAANPFSASISSSSSIDIERGNGSTQAGFTRWPQVALPNLHVAFDAMNVDTVASALNTVASLQATTTTPVATQVATSFDDSISGPLFAVVTNSTVPSFLDAPLPGPGVKLVGDNGETLVSLNSDEQLSALQAYDKDGKNILVLSGPDSASVRSLSSTLTAQPDGWFSLRGDTWFRAGEHQPSSVQARGGPVRVEPVAAATTTVLHRHRALFIIGAVIIVVALLGLLYPRMVSDRPTGGGTHAGAAHGRRITDQPVRRDLDEERPEFQTARPVQPASGSLENPPPAGEPGSGTPGNDEES
jgi:hypothetical protein